MTIHEQIKLRFDQLAQQAQTLPVHTLKNTSQVADVQPFYVWASSALNVIQGVFGKESSHYEHLNTKLTLVTNNYVSKDHLDACRGIFLGAKSDVDGGHVFNLQTAVSGEVFGDFVSSAKVALAEGNHTVAAVLACSALEDALKRYAAAKGQTVDGKTMDEVVNTLKAQGLVSGAQKSLLSTMPKIRNYAMHADWEKLTAQDAGSVIGFVEQFLLAHFS